MERKSLILILILIGECVAPVPRCSPFLLLNKLAEASNLLSDSSPYFPVPPCEHGRWTDAIMARDLASVFVLASPFKFARHKSYQLLWLLKTGIPRWIRVFLGQERFYFDKRIVRERYKHYTENPRRKQLGQHTLRNPRIIDDHKLFVKVMRTKLADLANFGPDTNPNRVYTPQIGLEEEFFSRRSRRRRVRRQQNS